MRRELALLVLTVAACDRAADGPAPSTQVVALASAAFYRVELAPPAPCARDVVCEARLVVRALGDFKVNLEYPHKLVTTPTPGVAVEGTGTFASAEPKTGILTVSFRAARAGTARIAGTLKLSVCTDEVCEIETPAIAFDVPVT